MSGKVTATSGQIGGNTLTSGSIFSGTGTFNAANTPFFLDSGGRFSLKNKLSFNGSSLVVNGDITAVTGQIAGWGISGDVLSSTQSDSIELDGENERITISSNTFGNTGIQLDNNGGNPKAFIGKSNGGFLKFDSSDASSQLQISSSGFILGQSGSGDTTGAFISGSKEGKLEVSSSKFHLKPTGDVIVSGKITSTEGQVGGWNMTTSSFNTGDSGDTMELNAFNNRITLYDAAKSHMAGEALIQIGKLESSANLPFGSSAYGIVLSGSNSNMGTNEVKLIAEQGDYGTPSDNFQYTSSVIQGKAVSKGGSIGGGRSGMYGESAFELGDVLPAGYGGSLSSQKGIMAGVVGSHRNFNNGFYRKTAGVMGVNSISKLNKTNFGSLIRTGSFGVVSVGPMYVTASAADHTEDGIGYSILAGSGYVHVSASSAGNFGGIGSGMIIDSSNTSGTSAGLRLVSDSSNTTEITSNGTGVQINKGAINTTGDTTFSGSYFSSTGIANKFDGGVVLTSFARNGTTKVTINHGSGVIDTEGYVTIDQGLGVGTAGTSTAGLIRATNDVIAFYSSDKRLKDNLIKIGNPLDKISQLNGYEFDWIAKEGIHENEGHDIGVIAQEVEKVLPEVVQTRDNGYKAVKYEKIVPLLIESIKELTQRVEELENGSS